MGRKQHLPGCPAVPDLNRGHIPRFPIPVPHIVSSWEVARGKIWKPGAPGPDFVAPRRLGHNSPHISSNGKRNDDFHEIEKEILVFAGERGRRGVALGGTSSVFSGAADLQGATQRRASRQFRSAV